MTSASPHAQPLPTVTGRELLPYLGQIRRDTAGYLVETARLHGDLVHYQVGRTEVFFINHPDTIRQVLQDNHRSYSKNTIQYNTLSSITGQGLLTSDGEDWLRHRRMAQPAFARPRLAQLDKIVVPATERMLAGWDNLARRGQPVNVDEEMMRLTLEIVGRALFSIDLSREAGELTHATLTALDHVIFRAQNFIYPPDWVPTPRNLRFRRALRRLDQAVYALIAERRSGQPGDDLLGMLLRARGEDNGAALTDQQLRDEIITLLIAGHETVASALTWSWYLLAQHPLEWQQMRVEAQNILGDRLPSSADLDSLPFTAQVFNEALRLYPPAWLITRRAEQEDQLGGQHIPVGSLMIISPYAVHRHPQFWENPNGFCPRRFTAEAEKARPRYAYIPFGGGPRLCIGNHFALIEAQLILAVVTQRYRLQLARPGAIEAQPLVTLRPRGGLWMRLEALEG